MVKMPPEKTLKRELAVLFSLALFFLLVKVAWFVEPAEVEHYTSLLTGIAWPILSFVAAAAGIHVLGRKSPDA